MSLEELHIDLDQTEPPPRITALLENANRRCDEFFDTDIQKTMPRFLPAKYQLVYQAIRSLQETDSLLGNRFCEWGSGLGAATCLAASMGFDACGIEIQPELIARSRTLAHDFQLKATFLETSFLPHGFDFLATQGGQELAKPRQRTGLGYQDVEWELEDVDLFYVYPWPEEQESTLELFDSVATEGAYLICYLGEDEICVYRKES